MVESDRSSIQALRSLDGDKRRENLNEISLRIFSRHSSIGFPECHIKKLLNNLKTHHAVASELSLADQPVSMSRLFGGRCIERVEEDVGVEERSIVHSSHLACNGGRC